MPPPPLYTGWIKKGRGGGSGGLGTDTTELEETGGKFHFLMGLESGGWEGTPGHKDKVHADIWNNIQTVVHCALSLLAGPLCSITIG